MAEPNHLLEAFRYEWNVVFLVAGLTLSMILGTTLGYVGLVSLALVLGVELGYLLLVPQLPAFKTWVKAAIAREIHHEKTGEYRSKLDTLPLELQESFKKLDNNIKEFGTCAKDPKLSKILPGLVSLRARYLEVLFVFKEKGHFLHDNPTRDLSLELVDVETALDGARGRLRENLERRHDLLETRLAQLRKAQHDFEVLRTELEAIQDVVGFALEGSRTFSDPGHIAERVDSIILDMGPVNAVMGDVEAELEEAFDELEAPVEVTR